MFSANSAEPDPSGLILFVGRDAAGHWLVQDRKGQLEGRFISRAAAWAPSPPAATIAAKHASARPASPRRA